MYSVQLLFFPEVLFHSRVIGACLETTDCIFDHEFNVRTTITTVFSVVPKRRIVQISAGKSNTGTRKSRIIQISAGTHITCTTKIVQIIPVGASQKS